MCVETMCKYVNDARIVFRALNGIFPLYKPPYVHYNRMRETVISNLCKELNEMKVRPPAKYVEIEGDTTKDMKVVVRNSFADHPLVVGPRYQPNDFRFAATKIMTPDVSGIIVCGLNKGNKIIHKIQASKTVRTYKVKGLMGQATNNYFHTGKIVEKSTYAHVRRGHIDKLCSSMQSSHQKKMFELCGVDIQSQAAYELALKGPIRPADPNVAMIYTIKCVYFAPPEFTLEIICANENHMYLKTIVHELGMQLRTNATCTQILCIQDGLFNIKHALLQKHWTLQDIVNSMRMCEEVLAQNESILHQEDAALLEPTTDTTRAPLIDHLS